MDNTRVILFIALSFILLLIWQQWQIDYGPRPPQTASATPPPAQPAGAAATAAARDESVPQVKVAAPTAPAAASAVEEAGTIEVTTDLFHLMIDRVGGSIVRLELNNYPQSLEEKSLPFVLLDRGDTFYIAQSGLIGQNAPDHYAVFASSAASYHLAAGDEQLEVVLQWQGESGVVVEKIYSFERGRYTIGVTQRVHNSSGERWVGRDYRQIVRNETAQTSPFLYTYTGAALYTPEERFQKIEFSDMRERNLDQQVSAGSWVAFLQHYFTTAWIPGSSQGMSAYSKQLSSGRYMIGLVSPELVVEPGTSGESRFTLFSGPKLQDEMQQAADGLELTVDYGVLTFLAQPLFWIMSAIHGVVMNWGWSIIAVTILIKLLFYKLSETSYRSMAQMKKLTPRLQKLKESYGNDRQKLNEKMMEMYRTEKINPLGGCLPILVQIPVFIALYWVLLESVEMRQAPWILWIEDLSTMDPYYVLPVIMGVTMVAQQRLNPTPLDPIQARVMQILPIVFTIFFAFFPAGLVLYWVVNSILSILQQWYITRNIAASSS